MNSFPKLYPNVAAVGELPPDHLEGVLRELDDESGAVELLETINRGEVKSLAAWFGKKPYSYANQTIGFIEPLTDISSNLLPIQTLGNIRADETLKGARIDIHLDRLRVYDYPGRGKHNVVVQFKANHAQQDLQTSDAVVFNQAFDVDEDSLAGVVGYPVFNGLVVGQSGVAFQLCTINAHNKTDEQLLSALKSDSVTSGLSLLTTAQPALKPFVDVGKGIVESLLKRSRNVKVQELFLGLDFGDAPLAAPMKCGNYIVVQVQQPQDLNWNDWAFDRDLWTFVSKSDSKQSLPYNYFVSRSS
ncbi:hypothetical protein SH528x_005425 [Novipirellula sp. SH528]|uniref:hypothetical protein n=1 Tax=Novipirellula sp. SH528 TaxID=3454466 RepID=UPI003F9EF7A1